MKIKSIILSKTLVRIVREESNSHSHHLYLAYQRIYSIQKIEEGIEERMSHEELVIETNKCTDLGVLNILKTLIENPKMVDILDGVDRNYLFSGYQRYI